MKNLGTLVLAVVLVLTIIGFSIFAVMAGGKISNNENAITTLEKNVTTLQTALNGSNGDIATLKGQIAAANTQISTLQGQVTADAAKLTTAQSQITAANAQVSTLQGQITALQTSNSSQDSQIAAANSSVAALQTTVTSLQSTVTTLQSTVNTLQYTGGATGVTQINYSPLSTGPTSYLQVASFTSTAGGTLAVTGHSNTTYGYLYVYNANSLVSGTQVNLPYGTTASTVGVPFSYAGTNYLYFVSTSGTTQGIITTITRY